MNCINCGDPAHFRCGTCYSSYYCSTQCQQQDKAEHTAHDCYDAHNPDIDDIFERIQLCLPEHVEEYEDYDHLGHKYLDILEEYPDCPLVMASAQDYLHDYYTYVGVMDFENYVEIAKKARRARLKAKRMKKKRQRKRLRSKAKQSGRKAKEDEDYAKAKRSKVDRLENEKVLGSKKLGKFKNRRKIKKAKKKADEAEGRALGRREKEANRSRQADKLEKREKKMKDEQTRLTRKKKFERDLKKQGKQNKKATRYADKAESAMNKGKNEKAMRYIKKGKKALGISTCLTCTIPLSQTYIECNECEKVHYCSIACANDDYERHDPQEQRARQAFTGEFI